MTVVAYVARQVLAARAARHGWFVSVEDDTIVEVGPQPTPRARIVDLGDVDLIPGLVDLHSDCWIERSHPRPTCELPLDQALVALDTEVVSSGITTHFLCIAIEDNSAKRRSIDQAHRCIDVLGATRLALRADHRAHLRFEVTGSQVDVARSLAAAPAVGLLSYMDHTPGHGQFRTEADWRAFYLRDGNAEAEIDRLLATRRSRRSTTDATRAALADVAHERNIALASHDDDTFDTVECAVRLGAVIAEFPVTEEAAKAAVAAGLVTLMGAPNAFRGASHLSGNLSARHALSLGCLDALASDYHPPLLLASAYELADSGACSWAEAMSLVTASPAAAIGLHDRGELTAGRRADMVAVQRRARMPTVAQTWVGGRACFDGRRAP